MARVAVYIRVSTADQNTDMQRREITSYCNARGWVAQVFEDQGVSGSSESRPGLNALMQDVRRRKFQKVVVWSASRLGRSTKHLLHLVEEFSACRVTLVSLKEGWDLSTPSGRLVFNVMACLAEFEREQTRERVICGLAAAKARGQRLGRPTVAYDTEEIRTLRAQGKTIQVIAKAVGVSTATVSRTLQNP